MVTNPKKTDGGLLANARARKRALEKEAATLKKQVSKLAGQLNEIQEKLDLIDKLIQSESPKKKVSRTVTPSDSRTETGMAGRSPAAIKK